MRRVSKKTTSKPDYILLSVVAILILLGIVILASTSATLSQERFGSPTFYLFRHILVGLIPGILLGFLAFKIPLSFLKKWAPVLLLANLCLMVLVFVPGIGLTFGGATRWINLGFISFQPSEFLKLSFILYLAVWLSNRIPHQPVSSRRTRLEDKFSPGWAEKKVFSQTLVAFLIVSGLISLLLILQPDISTLGIIIASGALIYFLAGTPLKHNLLIFSGGITGLLLLIKIAPYRLERFLVFLEPGLDPMGSGYHIKQALIAIGSGGIIGRGLAMSVQRFGFLPQPMSDSIFAIFSEETGFIGSLILISLFLIFAWQGFKIAKGAQDKFCKLACFGLTIWIILQAFVNIGAMVGILPLTGIPLPFVSYGGSALVAQLIGVGLLLNISKNT